MTNYQIGFQSKQTVAKALQKNFDATRTTRFFREGESLEQCILNIRAKNAKKNLENIQVKTPKGNLKINCSEGNEPLKLARTIDMKIQELEKQIETNPSDIEARTLLSKIKEAFKVDITNL